MRERKGVRERKKERDSYTKRDSYIERIVQRENESEKLLCRELQRERARESVMQEDHYAERVTQRESYTEREHYTEKECYGITSHFTLGPHRIENCREYNYLVVLHRYRYQYWVSG